MTTRKPRSAGELVPDLDLWEDVAQAVRPLSPKSGEPRRRTSTSRQAAAKPTAPPPAERAVPRRAGPASKPVSAFTGIDRRTRQKLTRGQLDYEARLDLHGHTIGEAHALLARFLEQARRRDVRLVLVITGKGASPFAGPTLHGASSYHVPERQGRLHRLLPEWLHEPALSRLVNGFQPAHPRHGGGGAYYVHLKRRREGHG
ncbi:MAG TPA: Smr/MutS family protein [Aestuariivirgaceae bacterium]|nr:Smr/MutS family protein [Aestuariivirgaceae bacterium]